MTIKDAVKQLINLSIPIILGQIGQMLIGAGDIYIASMYATETVASIGVANGVINPIFLFGIGLMMGVSPSLAVRRGEGKNERDGLFSIIIYSTVVGFALTFITLLANFLVPHFGFESSMVPSIQEYISIVAWSLPFAVVFGAIKEYLQAYEEVFFPNLLSIIAVGVNLVVNYILVFGVGSFEGYGEVGLAIASLIIRILLCLVLLLVVKKQVLGKFSSSLVKHVFKFSLPIAFMFFLEVLAFCTVTILSGKLGVIPAAANNIIMTLASIAFMIPLSVSSAVAVKVGHSYGLKNFDLIKKYSGAAIILIMIFVCFSASIFGLLPEFLMGLVSKDQEVIALGATLLFVVAIFQVVDSLQVILTGVLRGLNNTTVSSILVFIGYWVLGLPFGIYLAFYAGKGAIGLWIGLAVSLANVAVALGCFCFIRFKKLSNNDYFQVN